MTIVIQHEYYHLSVNNKNFNIGLSFNNKKSNLTISLKGSVFGICPMARNIPSQDTFVDL